MVNDLKTATPWMPWTAGSIFAAVEGGDAHAWVIIGCVAMQMGAAVLIAWLQRKRGGKE